MADPTDPLVGATVGNYEIESRIAAGGMGVVYRARHAKLDREVVVKVLAESLLEDDQAVARFEREARGLSQLDHPNIVTIHDFGHEGRTTYIVMELVRGETLSRRLKRHKRFTFQEYHPIFLQLLDALAVAHKRGLVHRDIKPSNLMLTEKRGRKDFLKVLDFGLARLTDSSVEITKNKSLVGTVAYIAPELIAGEKADPAADVYAIGILSYYVLTGVKPFSGDDDLAVLFQHVNSPPDPITDHLPDNHDVPDDVVELIHLCLSKDKEERPRDARDVLGVIQEELSIPSMPGVTGEWVAAYHEEPSRPLIDISDMVEPMGPGSSVSLVSSQLEELSQSLRRTKRVAILVAALLVAVLAVGAGAVLSRQVDPSASLAEANRLVDKSAFTKADAVLSTIDRVGLEPTQAAQLGELQSRVAAGRMLQSAKKHEAAGSIERARELYREVIELRPSDTTATAALQRLAPEETIAAVVLSISSTPSGAVTINGEPAGDAPLETLVPPGTVKIEIAADGYHAHSQQLVIESSKPRELEVSLVRIEPAAAQKSERRRKKPRKRPPPVAVKSQDEPQDAAAETPAPKTQPAKSKPKGFFESEKKDSFFDDKPKKKGTGKASTDFFQ